jgi:hypothetical protein
MLVKQIRLTVFSSLLLCSADERNVTYVVAEIHTPCKGYKNQACVTGDSIVAREGGG